VAGTAGAGTQALAGADSITTVGIDDYYLSIEGGTGDNDVRVVQVDGNHFLVSDTTGIRGCEQVDPQSVRCTQGRFIPDITYESNGGDDRLRVLTTGQFEISASDVFGGPARGQDSFEIEPGSNARARFSGYRDSDVLIGGPSYDFLSGGRGADRLEGRAGDDRLLGAQGRDELRGGPGDDQINAMRGRADDYVRCGPGDDILLLDRRAASRTPSDCETVKLR
jgi:Ca2+-binding RTX toxin-like protein